ncbi:thioesterase-like superfamily-domain-containing protein, partial [Dactylonectria macrodidyma]
NWLELLGGREGFITEKKWRALDSHQLFWGDMVSSHINNVMYNRYVETGRVQFIRHHGEDATAEEKKQWEELPTPRSLGLILKSITTEFKFPMEFPDRITVLYKLIEPPTYESTSLKMEARIFSEQHRRVAARCIDDTAIYDYTSGKKSVLKPFMVDKLRRTFELQTEVQKEYTEKANKAIAVVEELERAFK